MSKPIRTLLGRFRQDYWHLLVRDGGRLDACRVLFGDDREDYGEALGRQTMPGSPGVRRTDVIRHVSATGAKRLRRSARAVLDGLVLHLCVELGPKQDNDD